MSGSKFSQGLWLLTAPGATRYTLMMDSVRFGKALGVGARQAAKALLTAADAAAAPNSSAAPTTPRHGTRPVESPATSERLVQKAAYTAEQVRQTKDGVARGSRYFGKAVWGPFARLSGVLWLELTGVFFGLFLVTAVMNMWRLRFYLHDTALTHDHHQRLLFSIAMAVIFGYFSVSSFVRASRRQRRAS